MFLYIGQDQSIPTKDIVGIFAASTLQNAATSEFIRTASDEGFLVTNDKEQIKSFIVADEHVYFSAIVPSTLRRRSLSRVGAAVHKELSD